MFALDSYLKHLILSVIYADGSMRLFGGGEAPRVTLRLHDQVTPWRNAASEAAFRWGGHMVFQVQVAKSAEAVPLTRDYISEAERGLPLDLAPRPRQEAAE